MFFFQLLSLLQTSKKRQNIFTSFIVLKLVKNFSGAVHFSGTHKQIENVLNTKDFEKFLISTNAMKNQNNNYTLNLANRMFFSHELKLEKSFKKFMRA